MILTMPCRLSLETTNIEYDGVSLFIGFLPGEAAVATIRLVDAAVEYLEKPRWRSSRTTLNGEQPYPWDLLQPQDVMSRHRGAKPHRRCELLDAISLLSPAYLLSNERWPFHSGPPDH